jgi:hypothetical protein
LGLAFIVVILCAYLVMSVMKHSAVRESKYVEMITKFAPVIEGISISITDIKNSMEGIGTRLQNI